MNARYTDIEKIMEIKDCNGNPLTEGDNVKLARDLKVKGSSINLKRGAVLKNIRFTGNVDQVECRHGKSTIVLKTQFLQKA
jgi:protein PhnA